MECTSQLEAKEVEWSMTYIGSAQDNKHDQLLDMVEVETVLATMKFVFEAPPPNLFLVPKEDQLDNSAILLSAKYKGREFCRVGFYMRHEYPIEFVNSLRPPQPEGISEIVEPELPCGEKLNMQILMRLIDVDNPRVTHYLIDWDAPNEQLVPPNATEEVPDEDDVIDDDEEEDEDDEDEEDEYGEGAAEMDMDMGEMNKEKANFNGTVEENANVSMTHE